MRALDIDLDAFVAGTATYGAGQGQRLDPSEYRTWDLERVAAFLEQRCGLRRHAPRPGAVFEHHQEAFFYWQRLISAERLKVPFELVHLDAHSDMSSEGSGAHLYVLTELLAYPIAQRQAHLDASRVTFASFPVFAAALAWISSFTWVRPPTGDDGVSRYYVGDSCIHLKRYAPDAFLSHDGWRHAAVMSEDSPIPASVITTEDYHASGKFDFVTLCRSPQFTPATADRVFDLVREYIDEKVGNV